MLLTCESIGAASPRDEEVLGKIREKALHMYTKYDGVLSRRDTVSRQYDSRSGKLLATYRIVVLRSEYFYRRPTYVTLQYFKDGKELPVDQYRYRTRPPVYPPFDRDNDKNYTVRLKGAVLLKGRKCWEVEILPKERSARHLSGIALFDADTLDLVCLEGTVSSLPIGVRRVYMKLFFKSLQDATVISHGEIQFDIHVPLLYPHKRFVNTFTSSDERLIPKGG
ncbi:MAG: hypothetical protein JXA20_11450 [Spirochaetes bacterium]|nr:hypothetical protein [Spirochaetota bacterium]